MSASGTVLPETFLSGFRRDLVMVQKKKVIRLADEKQDIVPALGWK